MADDVMKSTVNQTQVTAPHPKPMVLVGAGPLTSAIWKLGSEQSGWRYRFNVVRQTSDRRQFTDLFQPTDLIHFVKLIQVLAAVIADEGCLTQTERTMLRNLAAELDNFLGGATVEKDEDAAPTHMNQTTRSRS